MNTEPDGPNDGVPPEGLVPMKVNVVLLAAANDRYVISKGRGRCVGQIHLDGVCACAAVDSESQGALQF
jgi:hypothetical protein